MAWLFAFTAAAGEKELLYLSGTGYKDTRTWEFFCTAGRNSGYWTTIEVPSHWEQQGFGEYDYGRDYRTYGKKFRFSDEKGLYRHAFTVPEAWNRKRVFIVFEGSMTDTEAKINGIPAGEAHRGAFYRFRYDITDKLKYGGENLLEAEVSKMSADPSVNRAERYADYWVFGGIFRPVYLEAFPEEHIDRIAIDARADGSFAMDLLPSGLKGRRTVTVELLDKNNRVAAQCSGEVSPGDSLVTLTCKAENPDCWSAENPVLYAARVSLRNGNRELHTTTEKFGFRTIEIRQGDGIYLNGTKIKMKGINRHAFWPESGRCLNDSINLQDVLLMKAMNMNAVRCAHYPPDKAFLHYCDSLGLYVLDELAGWQNAYSTEAGARLVKEMVLRDLNHPSVIFWSNGNEGGTNKELDDDFGLYDKSARPVIHAHHRPGNDYNGIDCNHYENYYSSQKILSEGKIYMPTEFLHAQDDGGGGAGLADFWELFRETPNAAGGFLWALLDEGIVRTDLEGFIDANRVNGPDGVVGPHREKEGSFYAIREIYCPVKAVIPDLKGQPSVPVTLENQYHFTNLADCSFGWELVTFPVPSEKRAGHRVVQTGNLQSPDIKPGETGTLRLDLPPGYEKYDLIYLTATDPSGQEIFRRSGRIARSPDFVKRLVTVSAGEREKRERERYRAQGTEEDNILPIERAEGDKRAEKEGTGMTETDTLITLKASGIAVSFSKTSGMIRSVTNDLGLPIPFNNGPLPAAGHATLQGMLHASDENGYTLQMMYDGALTRVTWTLYNSGWLRMDYEYDPGRECLFAGISFSFPESDILGVKWLGQGPAHMWKNRMQGGIYDLYQRMYNNRLPGDNHWGLPQFKGYYAGVSWMEFNTVDGKFTVVAGDEGLFVRLFRFHGISGPKNYPPLPSGDLSFLDAIPPVGTKLAMGISNDTWNLGPRGEMNKFDKPVKRTLFFYFGLL